MSEHEDVDDLSRRLAQTDFSADSRVRASLRAALLRKRRFSPARVASLSLVLAAAALVLLLPFRAKAPHTVTATVAVRLPLPAAAAPVPAPGKHRFPRGASGLPVLAGRFAANGPSGEEPLISTRALDRLVEIHPGRAVARKNGGAVRWDIDGATYILETRRISLDDIFETRAAL